MREAQAEGELLDGRRKQGSRCCHARSLVKRLVKRWLVSTSMYYW